MMNLKISLYANLRNRRPDLADRGSAATEATTIGELLAELDIAEAEAAIVFLNEKRAGLESELRDGDKVGIFPLLGGG
jgi:molybdopterin synthase sulfur carrier subunit